MTSTVGMGAAAKWTALEVPAVVGQRAMIRAELCALAIASAALLREVAGGIWTGG